MCIFFIKQHYCIRARVISYFGSYPKDSSDSPRQYFGAAFGHVFVAVPYEQNLLKKIYLNSNIKSNRQLYFTSRTTSNFTWNPQSHMNSPDVLLKGNIFMITR
jgi:hypothetical protein